MLKKADKWREKHGARFETSKYVLIHFTRKRAATADTSSITVSDTTIKPANEARYLGIILDKGLRFKQHIQYAANKGMKFALALSRIAKSTWGATYRQLRTLFNTIVATRMDYAAIVWHRPTKRGQTITSDKVEAAQRTAMKAIRYISHHNNISIGNRLVPPTNAPKTTQESPTILHVHANDARKTPNPSSNKACQ